MPDQQKGLPMEQLLHGLMRFQTEVFPQQRELFERLASNQQPKVLFITCADSRVVPELITQSGPGDLFICRNPGNIVPPYGQITGGVSAGIEYAVMVLGVRHIVVCGHSDCGAMKGVLHPESLENIPTVRSWLRHAEVARHVVDETYPQIDEPATLDALTDENVVAQLDHLRTHPAVAARLASGQIELHGWVYRINTGEVFAFDGENGRFTRIEGSCLPVATPRPRRLATAS
jgi:carbonic anhydrase